ncbi:hypothetical protein I7I50_02146 [Histoplasma capsulatum G186AR]|uniref:Uncharacterized protein n=1 Tax=Ajellomyces capsulatus TaxID=5037 RepID=A0A8H8CU18_AJECA|nr:hypothetical protein I7I52_12360 [Histoplasma capsulatum]QSS71346.1 hypothetical protein I7I50_02146 [Histoplasma capsulatum G186AR]
MCTSLQLNHEREKKIHSFKSLGGCGSLTIVDISTTSTTPCAEPQPSLPQPLPPRSKVEGGGTLLYN